MHVADDLAADTWPARSALRARGTGVALAARVGMLVLLAAAAGRAAALPAGFAGWVVLAVALVGAVAASASPRERRPTVTGLAAAVASVTAALLWPGTSVMTIGAAAAAWAALALALGEVGGQIVDVSRRPDPHAPGADALAALPDATAFARALAVEVDRATRYQRPLSVLICRAHGIAAVRRAHGDETADGLLRIIAGLSLDNVRTADQVGRLDGEEFGMILPETPAEGAGYLADRFLRMVDLLRVPGTRRVPAMGPDVRVGVAALDADADTAAALLARARAGAARGGGEV